MSKKDETNYKKGFGAFGLALLTGFTSPIAFLGTEIGATFLANISLNKKAKEMYEKAEEISKKRNLEISSFYPESSETAIARREPLTASKLLKEYSHYREYEEALNSASEIAQNYFSNISPKTIAKSKGVRVSFKKRRNLAGFLNEEHNKFKLNIYLK